MIAIYMYDEEAISTILQTDWKTGHARFTKRTDFYKINGL
jgi:hypothetical protein